MADALEVTPESLREQRKHHAGVPLHKRYEQEASPFKEWLGEFLESRAVEFVILLLVLCDVVLVAIEAGIDFKIICVAGQVIAQSALSPGLSRVKAVQREGSHVLQPIELVQKPILVCDSPEGQHAEHITHICHLLSIAILCIFMVELILKIWVHCKEFFRSAFEVLDLVIVSLSLICDLWISKLVESGGEEEGSGNLAAAETASALLIILRFWRIVRIIHGFYEIEHMDSERTMKQLKGKDAEIARLKVLVPQSA